VPARSRIPAPERREQLLAAARELFVARGYRTTTAEVAAAAGVSDALVVKHFGTKEELFRAAIAEPVIAMFEVVIGEIRENARVGDRGTPAEHRARLREMGAAWMAIVRDQRELVVAVIRESAAFADVAAHLGDLFVQLAEDLAASLPVPGDCDDYGDYDPRVLTYSALGAFTLAAFLDDDPEEFAAAFYDTVFLGVLSSTGRRRLRR
jgi:AcrR family transcriptional regulator